MIATGTLRPKRWPIIPIVGWSRSLWLPSSVRALVSTPAGATASLTPVS